MISYVDLYHLFFHYVQPLGWEAMTTLVRQECYVDDCEWLLRWLTAGEDLVISEHDFLKFVLGFQTITRELDDIYQEEETDIETYPLLEDTGFEIGCLDSDDEGPALGFNMPSGNIRLLLPSGSPSCPDEMTSIEEVGDVLLPFGLVNAPPLFQEMIRTLMVETRDGCEDIVQCLSSTKLDQNHE